MCNIGHALLSLSPYLRRVSSSSNSHAFVVAEVWEHAAVDEGAFSTTVVRGPPFENSAAAHSRSKSRPPVAAPLPRLVHAQISRSTGRSRSPLRLRCEPQLIDLDVSGMESRICSMAVELCWLYRKCRGCARSPVRLQVHAQLTDVIIGRGARCSFLYASS